MGDRGARSMTGQGSSMPKPSGRALLPDDCVPVRYDLKLEPDLQRFTFNGSVDILLTCSVATSEIHIHAKEVHFNAAKFVLFSQDGQAQRSREIDADQISFIRRDDAVKIVFPEFLPVGEEVGILRIPEFRGTLNNLMAGFYRNQYKDSAGRVKYIAATHFEPIDARRAFPCFDEPARKAVFNISITTQSPEIIAVSNMPEKSKRMHPDGRVEYSFFPTPRMSTYIIAFAVGEFDFVQGQTKSGTLMRCLSTDGNGKVQKLGLSLTTAIRSLEWYDEYFGIPYNLPKLDCIALPEFPIGAMENWGLVTYREILLLCDPKRVSIKVKQSIANVIAHEFAHMWFGNLVTMEWWEDLWLKEGFATFMASLCIDALFPEWNCWEEFVASTQGGALNLDSLRSSHPIQVPIERGEQVMEIFDAISYYKGSSVIRMVYATLGAADFQKGIQLYMQRHAYGNTETTDLWQAWSETSGKPVAKMMSGWTDKMGYPVLTVGKEGDGQVNIQQKWFLADNSVQPRDEEALWVVPVLVATEADGPDYPRGLVGNSNVATLSERDMRLPVNFGNGRWVKINAGQYVPIRVAYSEELFSGLIDAVKQCKLCAEDRIGLLGDTYSLCKSGHYGDVSFIIRLLDAFRAEGNANVWGKIVSAIQGLASVMAWQCDAVSERFRTFAASFLKNAFQDIGWNHKEGDSDLQKQLRGQLVGLVASFLADDSAIQAEARIRYEAWIADHTTTELPDDYKTAVFEIVLNDSQRGAEVFATLADLLGTCAGLEQAHRTSILLALGRTPDMKLKLKYLDMLLGMDSVVKLQDIVRPLASVNGSGRQASDMCFDWLCQNWKNWLDGRKAWESSLLRAVVESGCIGFSEERAVAIDSFFTPELRKKSPQIERTIKQTIEKTKLNAAFVDRVAQSKEVSSDEFWAGLCG